MDAAFLGGGERSPAGFLGVEGHERCSSDQGVKKGRNEEGFICLYLEVRLGDSNSNIMSDVDRSSF